jgi:hypothetical protein
MFRNALHASVGAQAQRLDRGSLRRRPAAVLGSIAEAAFAAVVVALFLGWLMSDRDPASGRGAQCVSFGRGGALCAEAARDPDQGSGPHLEDNCMSLGKGGRLCFARPARAGS